MTDNRPQNGRVSFDSDVFNDTRRQDAIQEEDEEDEHFTPPGPAQSASLLGTFFDGFSFNGGAGRGNFQRLSSDETNERAGRPRRRSLAMTASPAMSFKSTLHTITITSKLNLLLVFVPIGITLHFISGIPAVIVFACNTIALVPLSSLLSYATECIASDLGDTVGALINISLGNLIELITLFVALKDGKVHIVQGALVGSILVNLLLVLGSAIMVGDFFASGLEQQFDVSHAQALASLLALSVMSILIPIGFHYSMEDEDAAKYAVASMSRISALILLFVYGVYVFFLLRPRRRIASPASIEDGTAGGHRRTPSGSALRSQGARASRPTAANRTIRFADPSSRRARHRRVESIELSPMSPNRIQFPQNDETNFEDENKSFKPASPTPRAGTTSPIVNKHRRGGSMGQVPLQGNNESGPSSPGSPSSRRMSVTRSRSRSLTMPGSAHMDIAGRYTRNDSLANILDVDDEESMTAAPNNNTNGSTILGSSLARSARRPGRRSVADLTSTLGNDHHHHSSNININFTAGNPSNNIAVTLAAPLEGDEDEGLPPIGRKASLILLIGASIMTAISAELIVANIEKVTAATGFSNPFIGLIVLPIASNTAEFITAISVAAVGKSDLALGVSFGSSIQISLFVAPLMILAGWILNEEMTLDFGMFDTIALMGSALVVNVLITNGRSNYLEGCLLVACYLMVAVGAFLSP